MRIYTIGHSTRSLDELVHLLRASGVKRLADIRRYPGSRRYPHFSRDSLAAELPKHGIAYVHMPELGGRRNASKDSPNDALRNAQFRGYADYMATKEFAEGIDHLQDGDAIMCAEAVPWRCHRSFVADDLVRRGVDVVHILGPNDRRKHELNPLAHDAGGHLVYARRIIAASDDHPA
ncbi:MAG TPA: DUF488 domain-containing protein [Thermoanaerobaculia bacterium]|nr:DUF488 domain-containing protein [Thermoanaerobaculia bacterium]